MATHLHEILHDMAPGQEGKPAVVCADSGNIVSYGELLRKVDAIAARLSELQLRPGDRIAILARKSADTIAAFLGASRLGVVFAPLDIAASPNYWSMVLGDLAISIVLSDIDEVRAQLPGFQVVGICGDAKCDVRRGAHTEVTSSTKRIQQDDAYILSTSGSTGRPKGVLLSHENALAFSNWAAGEVELGPADKVLNIAPFHFDLSVFDIYATLSRGACMVIAPGMATMFPGQLAEAIEMHQISVLYSVPTILRTLQEAGAFAREGGKSLRRVMYAGEPFPAPSLAKLMDELPHVTFHNFFGPTETNVCLAHRVEGRHNPDHEIPIGRPASGNRVSLVDERGAVVNTGEIGQLTVDGPTVMKGYITAEGFEPAKQPYATGDFAIMGDDGSYYFRGRRDSQVKVRGTRIELGSVERALSSVTGVKEAVALVIERDLVGFVGGAANLDDTVLRNECLASLPPGAVPHRFIAMDSFPRLSNGKVDLVKLKSYAIERPQERART